jgi:hypothetical protein
LLAHEMIDQATLALLLTGLEPTMRRELVASGRIQACDVCI